jgi:hypothetical protein
MLLACMTGEGIESWSRTIDRLALGQVVVGWACKKAVTVTSNDALDVAVHWD